MEPERIIAFGVAFSGWLFAAVAWGGRERARLEAQEWRRAYRAMRDMLVGKRRDGG